MENELFWIILSAIGTILASFATTAAVIVALWQTRFSSRKKLKLIYNDPITIVNDNGQRLGNYIGITIINTGNRDVIISDWSIICKYKKKHTRYKIVTEMQGLLKKSLPIRLSLEESVDLSYERKFFIKVVNEIMNKQEINPKHKIKFQIMDSTGKKYFVYSKSIANSYACELKE